VIYIDELLKTNGAFFNQKLKPKDVFPGFRKGCSMFAFNAGNFSFIDVIKYIINETGPCHAFISAWVGGAASIKKVLRFLRNDRFLSVRFLFDRILPNTRPDDFGFLVENFGIESVRILRTHAKFCVLWNSEWYVVIETSANLNKNLRLEFFRITEDEKFCGFFMDFMENVFRLIPPPSASAKLAQKVGTRTWRPIPGNIPSTPLHAEKPKTPKGEKEIVGSWSFADNLNFDL
jgi:hypothetical protein